MKGACFILPRAFKPLFAMAGGGGSPGQETQVKDNQNNSMVWRESKKQVGQKKRENVQKHTTCPQHVSSKWTVLLRVGKQENIKHNFSNVLLYVADCMQNNTIAGKSNTHAKNNVKHFTWSSVSDIVCTDIRQSLTDIFHYSTTSNQKNK